MPIPVTLPPHRQELCPEPQPEGQPRATMVPGSPSPPSLVSTIWPIVEPRHAFALELEAPGVARHAQRMQRVSAGSARRGRSPSRSAPPPGADGGKRRVGDALRPTAGLDRQLRRSPPRTTGLDFAPGASARFGTPAPVPLPALADEVHGALGHPRRAPRRRSGRRGSGARALRRSGWPRRSVRPDRRLGHSIDPDGSRRISSLSPVSAM